MSKVLLVEDDASLAFMIKDGLESEDFEVLHFHEAEVVMEQLPVFRPDIVLLDVNLKGAMDGFELSRKIRLISQVPVIFITSRTQIEDLQEAFKIRNIDYLKKPFGIRELVLRINELLVRFPKQVQGEKNYQIGEIFFSPSEQNLKMVEEKVRLQKNECAVLTLLCENKGKVVNKKNILEAVWNSEPDLKLKEASLHNILSSLRSKLSKDENIIIETIPKIGWMLKVSV